MRERLSGSVTRAEPDVPKAAVKLEAPVASLGSSRFDVLYAELKFNSLPDKVYGEWEI